MESIAIRSIQHFLYCPHRWGLMEIGQAWAENYFVARGTLMHQRVHDAKESYTARGKRVYTSVPVWNDREEYDLFGIVDCLEAEKGQKTANDLPHPPLCIVEYKPHKPQNAAFHKEDAMQVFAQKICVDAVFGGDCKAAIYYGNTKRRVALPFEAEFDAYDALLKETLEKMRRYLREGTIPPISKGQKCSGCSMKDICMPNHRRTRSVRKDIMAALEEVGCENC